MEYVFVKKTRAQHRQNAVQFVRYVQRHYATCNYVKIILTQCLCLYVILYTTQQIVAIQRHPLLKAFNIIDVKI